MNPAQVAIKSSTQDFIEIEDIKDDLVILKDGSCCLVLKINAVNFGLLSESEQDALIYAYSGMLNSLSFSIQIVIRSKRKDITAYLNLLKAAEEKQLYGPLKEQIEKYRLFVETTVKVNNVLDKKFYIVIPFSLLEMGVASAFKLFGRKKGLPYSKSYILERAKTALYPKRDHLLRQLNRLGLKAHQFNTQELIQLFYDVYNPGSAGMENIGGLSEGLTAPMVEAAVSGSTNREFVNSNNGMPAAEGASPISHPSLPESNTLPAAILKTAEPIKTNAVQASTVISTEAIK